MPRQPRLDAPETLHHVMVRGLERRDIFKDDTDRGACRSGCADSRERGLRGHPVARGARTR